MKKLILCAGVFVAVSINAHLASRATPIDHHEQTTVNGKMKTPATAITAALAK